jgi:predicted metalloprotease
VFEQHNCLLVVPPTHIPHLTMSLSVWLFVVVVVAVAPLSDGQRKVLIPDAPVNNPTTTQQQQQQQQQQQTATQETKCFVSQTHS